MSTDTPPPTTTIVGLLLNASASESASLPNNVPKAGPGRPDERPATAERLRVLLRAALKLAEAEQRRDPGARVFVGVFGLDGGAGCPATVDVCGVVDALLGGGVCGGGGGCGRDRLVARVHGRGVAHVERYIRERVTDGEAGIVDAYLGRHPERVEEFVRGISPGRVLGLALGAAGALGGGQGARNKVAGRIEDYAVRKLEATHLVRRICAEWLHNFTGLEPRPVDDVSRLLTGLLGRSEADEGGGKGKTRDSTLFDTLRRYMYGGTPMQDALSRSLMVFKKHLGAQHRVLVLLSGGLSTDGDPLPLTRDLEQAKRALFDMATRVSGVTHPIPVLASAGWEVPSAGEIALHSRVSSPAALDEFCSVLLSARFGSADAVLDVVGRTSHDSFINDEHVLRCRDPSNRGDSDTCHAHAIAAVIHMALLRIVGRENGYPSIEEIRKRIEDELPSGRSTLEALRAATTWYPPLRFRRVDEDGARQAVLRWRPALTTFHLSKSGWGEFAEHFKERPDPPKHPLPALSRAQMAAHRYKPSGGRHAAVLTSCNPHSLTFLNSWGDRWGNNGSFSVEDHTVLELSGTSGTYPVNFYDVYWLKNELTAADRQAYDATVDEEVCDRVAQYPSLLEREMRCFHCHTDALQCPRCTRSLELSWGV
ncbi:hypothetical protein B0I37DRAFT_430400 [Chaetomium sp. MPI-CAGE-AT-0009]|nr:hypothetical protein B0I37DRAFT_430400 [Chaetomium sp. MPI-CAGE-AT-0009]